MRAYPRNTQSQSYVPPHAKGQDGTSQPARTLEDIEWSTLYLEVLLFMIAWYNCFLRDLLSCCGRLGLTAQAYMCPSTTVQPSLQLAPQSKAQALHKATPSR